MFLNKKGVSPLVATLLLIVFSVLLGVAVMSWGKEFIEQKAEFVQGATAVKSACESAQFSIIELMGKRQLCTRKNVVEAIIENGPDVDLYDLHARIIGSKEIAIVESALPRPLPKRYALKLAFGITPVGEVQQVKLVPKVKINGNVVYCANSASVFENVPECS